MSHDHSHHNHDLPANVGRAFLVGIILNGLFVIVETVAGFYYNSLALLTDAGHNLSDVGSLALALLAFRLAKVKPSDKFTYGFQKTTILVALLNSVILLVAIGSIGWEATTRLFNPESTKGDVIAWVAAFGIVINSITAFLFFRNKEKDLNIKGAYLHLAADAAVSLGVVIAGVVMMYTNWFWLDSAISYLIIVVIFISTWKLLKQTVRLSLDAVPHNVDLEKVKTVAKKINGVKDIHHIHIWAMSTTKNAITAHIILNGKTTVEESQRIKHKLKHELEHLNIHHATLETETENDECDDEKC